MQTFGSVTISNFLNIERNLNVPCKFTIENTKQENNYNRNILFTNELSFSLHEKRNVSVMRYFKTVNILKNNFE